MSPVVFLNSNAGYRGSTEFFNSNEPTPKVPCRGGLDFCVVGFVCQSSRGYPRGASSVNSSLTSASATTESQEDSAHPALFKWQDPASKSAGGVLPCLARSRCQETRAATNITAGADSVAGSGHGPDHSQAQARSSTSEETSVD